MNKLASGALASANNDQPVLTVTVVVCAFTERRIYQLKRCILSLYGQTRPVDEIVLVIDHNEHLFEIMSDWFACLSEVHIVKNEGRQGLSAARNTGVSYAKGNVIVFLDDDAWAEANFLERMLVPYENIYSRNSTVYGAGGRVNAVWPSKRPRWFPPEFDWVVGCSYLQPNDTPQPVRNFIGAAMSFRKEVFDYVGGFDEDAGRVGSKPLGCEETELCIRLKSHYPNAQLIQLDTAQVNHEVTQERARLRYFVKRCWSEGISKAFVASIVGANAALSEEKGYLTTVLPLALGRELRGIPQGQIDGIMRSAVIMIGIIVTTLGYLRGRLTSLYKYFNFPVPIGKASNRCS
ncbi:MAG: glycosyltransferase [Actinobacteria bacterium]|nr:glycosyltransferase [Actinomycetota bacterium]